MADSDLTAKDLVSVNGRESVTAPIEQAETNEALTAAIARLPEYPRAVLFGLMEGRTLEDIARERGVSKQAVGMTAANARKAALRIMQRAGFKGVDSDGVLLAKVGEAPFSPVISPTGHEDWSVITDTDARRSKGRLSAGPIRVLFGCCKVCIEGQIADSESCILMRSTGPSLRHLGLAATPSFIASC